MKKEREKHNSKIYTIEKIQIKKVLSHQEILYIIDIWQNFYNILLFSKEKVLCDTQHLKMETKSNLQFPVPNSSTIKLEKLYIGLSIFTIILAKHPVSGIVMKYTGCAKKRWSRFEFHVRGWDGLKSKVKENYFF